MQTCFARYAPNRATRLLLPGLMILLSVGWLKPAEATITDFPFCSGGQLLSENRFETCYKFDFQTRAHREDSRPRPPRGPFWKVELNSTVGETPIGNTGLSTPFADLTINAKHQDNNIPANFSLHLDQPGQSNTGVIQKNLAATAQVIEHGNNVIDVYKVTALGFGPGIDPISHQSVGAFGTLTVDGEHLKRDQFRFMGSIHNPGSYPGPNGNLQTGDLKELEIGVSYPDKTKVTLGSIPTILKAGHNLDGIELPRKNPKDPKTAPTNYTVAAHGSPLTKTTLAFLGTDNGVLTELPLDALTELFVGSDEFFVPFLRAVDDSTNLYVNVDLTEWLSDPRSFMPGDLFSFANGLSSDLPGFFVSTSDIPLFNPRDGFTGEVITVAYIDGQSVSVPEPASIFVLGASLVALVVVKRRRRQPARVQDV